MMKLKKKKNKNNIAKRAFSLVVSFTMLLSSIYVSEIEGIFDDVRDIAYAVVPNPTKIKEIKSLQEFIDFSNEYSSTANTGDIYRLNITTTDVLSLGDTYTPLGTADKPFRGEIIITSTGNNYPITLEKPLFNYTYDSTEIKRAVIGSGDSSIELQLYRSTDADGENPLFANHVVHDTLANSSPATWSISSDNNYSFSGLIGSVGSATTKDNTVVNLIYNKASSAPIQSSGNVGLICGTMNEGAKVNVTLSGEDVYSVTSTGGSAGGIVGVMNKESEITVTLDDSFDISAAKTISAQTENVEEETYAGGLVGKNIGGIVTLRKVKEEPAEVVNNSQNASPKYPNNIDDRSVQEATQKESDSFDNDVNSKESRVDDSFESISSEEISIKKDNKNDGSIQNKANENSIQKNNSTTENLESNLSEDDTNEAIEEKVDKDSIDEPVNENKQSESTDSNETNEDALLSQGDSAVEDDFEEPTESDDENAVFVSRMLGAGAPTYVSEPYTAKGIITANTAAGGVFGYYAPSDDVIISTDYIVEGCKINAKSVGGYFGILEASLGVDNHDISVLGTLTSKIAVDTVLIEGVSVDNFGGLVGKYTCNDLTKTFDVQYVEVSISLIGTPSFNSDSNVGGIVGYFDGNLHEAYIKVDNCSVEATDNICKNSTYFGGVVGKNGTKGSFIDVGSVIIETSSGYKGGGIVGYLNTGILRLSGVTDLTDAKSAAGSSYGQIVGKRGASLVYSIGTGNDSTTSIYNSGWRFLRCTSSQNVDDIGTWGEVVRLNSGTDTIETLSVLTNSSHTVTIAAAERTMDSTADLVSTALNIQLNGGKNVGALHFADVTNESSTLLAATDLKISGSQSFTGTGITSFTRDDGANGAFSGTLAGISSGTITLAVGEEYGISGTNTTAKGQIYAHTYNGLFAKIGGGTISSLTINGTINHRATINSVYIGGACAEITNGMTLSGVTVSETINYAPTFSDAKDKSHYIGGIAGLVNSNNSNNISVSSSSVISPTINATNKLTAANLRIAGGIANVASVKTFEISFDTVTISPKVYGTTDVNSTSESLHMAGLIADIAYNGANSDSDTRTVKLSSLTITGCEVKNKASKISGGLLGFNWFNTNVELSTNTFSSGNLLYSDATQMAALVYRATGYWQVKANGLVVNSLTIKNSSESTISKNAVKQFGFIVNKGYYDNDGKDSKSAIYLEMQAADSFALGSDGAGTGVIVPAMTSGVYDELVAYTSDDVLANKSGVISYYCKTNNGTLYMDGTNCNSYQNVFNKTLTNGNSRYYYNYYQNKTNTNDAWKTLRWSLSVYAANNISAQFPDPFSGGGVTLKGTMTGVSYYPVDIDDGVTLNVSSMDSLLFKNYHFEKSEMVASNKGNTDSLTRSTLLSDSQHYLMHTGVFRNVEGTINITGSAKFKGTIGYTSDYSGAFINGTLTGTVITSSSGTITFGNNSNAAFNDNSLQFITVGETAPVKTDAGYLFINKIGSNATLNLNKVRISYNASTDTYASSLIGDVVGQKITLVFSDIKIDSRTAEATAPDLTTVYTTKNSIFKNAIFLNKFDVDSTSNAQYNFSQNEDWGTSSTRSSSTGVTYGKEITDSQNYLNKQKQYYDITRNYTHPTEFPTSTTEAGDFSTGYLPYVRYSSQAASGNTYTGSVTYGLREIKVNVKSVDIAVGCGTYDHPYFIDSPDQLKDLAATINGPTGGTFEPINNLSLPKTVANKANNYHYHWCYNGDFTCDANYAYNSDTGKYTSTTSGAADWELNQVREYLAGAYYEISGTLVLTGSDYVGLGASNDNSDAENKTGKYAFRGVIIGVNGGTINNNTSVPLIKISNGCVVKDLVVNVNTGASKPQVVSSASNASSFSYTQSNLYYGGLIGEIMGGDNIIDNVKMTYTKNGNRSLNVKNLAWECVGGYVGVVVNGGLIFRNMSSDDIAFAKTFVVGDGDSSLSFAKDNTYSKLYVNPYVGRVINGYAINETGTYTSGVYNNDGKYSPDNNNSYTLDNSRKNYRISDVNPQDTNKLSVTTFTPSGASNSMQQLSIPSGQSLFILSLITQSGAGTAKTATGDYEYGIGYEGTTRYNDTTASLYSATHLAQYDSIGTTSEALKNEETPVASSTVSDYSISTNDKTADKTAVPYIIYKYTTISGTSYPLRTVTGYGREKDGDSSTPDEGWYLKLTNTTDNYVYNLPDSFRGIGSICRNKVNTDEDGKFSIKLYGFDGNGKTINIFLYNNVYQNNNDNYQNTVYTANNIFIGYGLFNSFKQIKESSSSQANVKDGYYIGNFKLGGKIEEKEYDTNGNLKVACGLRNSNNSGNGSKSSPAVGGVVGALTHSTYVNFYDLDLYNLDIDAYSSNAVGGYIGRTNITEVDSVNGNNMSNIYANGCDTDLLTINATQAGCGGILGVSYSGFACIYVNTLQNNENNPKSGSKGSDNYYKSVMKMSITNNASTLECGTGGIVGCVRNGYNMNLWINNVTVAGNNSASKLENPNDTTTAVNNSSNSICGGVGGLIGYIRKAETVYITNTEVKNISIRGPQAGGMFGNIAYEYSTTMIKYGLPPLVKIYNSKVYVDDSEHEYDITGIKYTGGVSGQFTTDLNYSTGARVSPTDQNASGYNLQDVEGYKGDTYTYDIENCEVYGYTIAQSGSSTGTGVGGIIGNASCGDNNTLVGTDKLPTTTKNRSIVNTSVHDCTIKTYNDANNGLGGIIGYTTCTIYGYNIVAYDNTFSDSANGSTTACSVGNFLGYNNGSKSIKVVGFSRQNNVFSYNTSNTETVDGEEVTIIEDHPTGITVECGNGNGTGGYIVCSDYTASFENTQHGTAFSAITSATAHIDDGAKDDYFPYAVVNPVTKMGSTAFLTSDGATLYDRYTKKTEINGQGEIVDVLDANNEVVYESSRMPIAQAIVDDIEDDFTEVKGSVNTKYTGYKTNPDDKNKVKDMLDNARSDQDSKLTTYGTELTLPDNVDDFPVLVFDGTTTGNDPYTQYITSYIRLMTNTSEAYIGDESGKYKIEIYPCRYDNGNYYRVTDSSAKKGLTFDTANSRYTVNSDNADTIQPDNQISLIDVQYYDPMDNSKIAYHLYVPVIVKKMPKINFYSSILQGSDYKSTDYVFGNSMAVNFDSWATMYVKYEYSADAINTILDTGKGLKWNNEKIVKIRYTDQKNVADSTQFVLVDNNNNIDKAYYLSKSEKDNNVSKVKTTVSNGIAEDVLELSKFQGFNEQNLYDFVGDNLRYEQTSNGLYQEVPSEASLGCIAKAYDAEGNTVKYFKAAVDGDNSQRYSLRMRDKEEGEADADVSVSETYYISMYTYSDDNTSSGNTTNTAYGFQITCPLTLGGDITAKQDQSTNANGFIGDVFEQSLVLSNPTVGELVNSDNHELSVDLTATVKFKESDQVAFFQNMLNRYNVNLYQGFVLYLNRYDDGGTQVDSIINSSPEYSYTTRIGNETPVTENGSINENASYLYIQPAGPITIPASSTGTVWSSTQTATAKISFSELMDELEEEFPIRYDENSAAGIGFYATANLEYSYNRTENSNQIQENNPLLTNRYYIQKQEKAVLTLTALDQSTADAYDTYGSLSSNKSSLGINAKYINTGEKYATEGNKEKIDVSVNYDISALPNESVFNGNNRVKFTVRLLQKQNPSVEDDASVKARGFKYVEVPMSTYLEEFKFISKNSELVGSANGNMINYFVDLPNTQDLENYTNAQIIEYLKNQLLMDYDEGQFSGRLSFYVKTANNSILYSNYKLDMTAEIVKKSDDSNVFDEDVDYIIYTNAKLNASFVSKAS